jgi:UDP:flavonoid glycosyltransferase YjiC (YdhE family)
MHINIVAFGTHGDVQPMVALGKGLQVAGHTVQIIAGTNFVEWVRSHGLECAGTIDVMAVMQSDEGLALAENPRKQMGLLKRMMRQHGDEMLAPVNEAAPHSDLMISSLPSDQIVQMMREKHGVRQVSVPMQPYRPTRSGRATLMTPFPHDDNLVNLWIGSLFEHMFSSVAVDLAKPLRSTIGLPPITTRTYKRLARTMPVVYGFSPHVVPPPPDWDTHVQIAGFLFLDHPADYQPPAPLVEFLSAGETPVYIGFGSMANRDPETTFRLMCDALERAEQRGVIATGWSGAKAQSLPKHVFVLESVPHSWLFPRMAGVVHHGGAGTTAAGLRAGVPSLLIPHTVDQPYWARRLKELSVSPAPIPRKKLAVEKLAQGIRTLVRDTALRERAARLGDTIRAEQGVANAVSMIEQAAKG